MSYQGNWLYKIKYIFDANSCVLSALHEQSADINQVLIVPKKNKGQAMGMMFGYATKETENYMPLALDLSHKILEELAEIRKNETDLISYLRPDAKSQVTIEYSDDNVPQRIDTIVVSTQHDDFDDESNMLAKIKKDIIEIVIPRVKDKLSQEIQSLFTDSITYHINPTGKFVIGGPHGDTGLTGRKIIVDTYGGKGAHGGGAFLVKTPLKLIDLPHMLLTHCKNLVAAALGRSPCSSFIRIVAEPCGLFVNTYGTSQVDMTDGEIANIISEIFDMRPYFIEERLKLRNPIYKETAAYGHMGRKNETVKKSFKAPDGTIITKDVELFTWEKLDYVDAVKVAFGL